MKNKKALFLLLLTNIISGFAQGVSMLSIPWYFTRVMHLESYFGIVYMLVTLVSVVWSLYAGALIDRYSRKKVFVMVNIAGALVLCGVAAKGFVSGPLGPEMIALVFAATILIFNVHYAALYAFGQELSAPEQYGKINSLFEIQGQATTMLSGAIGAVLISGTQNRSFSFLGFSVSLPFDVQAWDMHHIFLMDGITYILAIFLILSIRYIPDKVHPVHTGSALSRIRMGIAYLREHPLIFLFGNMSHAVFLVLIVEVHLLLPWYVSNHLGMGADVYASAEIYYTFGALFAGLAIRSIFRHINEVTAVIRLMILTVLIFLICAFTRDLWVFFVFSILIGLTNAGTRVLRITYLFHHIPNNLMGRANSVFQTINIFLRAVFIGLFSLPFFSKGSNVTWAYLIDGVVVLLSVIPLLIYHRSLREIQYRE